MKTLLFCLTLALVLTGWESQAATISIRSVPDEPAADFPSPLALPGTLRQVVVYNAALDTSVMTVTGVCSADISQDVSSVRIQCSTGPSGEFRVVRMALTKDLSAFISDIEPVRPGVYPYEVRFAAPLP